MAKDRRDVGQQPRSIGLRAVLAALVPKREPTELIVIHHFTDTPDRLQLEVERRSSTLGIHFERVIIFNEPTPSYLGDGFTAFPAKTVANWPKHNQARMTTKLYG